MTDRIQTVLVTRIDKALKIAIEYGGIDGDRHKTWVIDQIVRTLTGCPMEPRRASDNHGNAWTYEIQGENAEYQQLVRDACAGKDGPETYSWDTGIAP